MITLTKDEEATAVYSIIEAVKLVRFRINCGLKEARDSVVFFLAKNGLYDNEVICPSCGHRVTAPPISIDMGIQMGEENWDSFIPEEL